jgi:hypothetical protein
VRQEIDTISHYDEPAKRLMGKLGCSLSPNMNTIQKNKGLVLGASKKVDVGANVFIYLKFCLTTLSRRARLRRLVAGLFPRRLGFDVRSVDVVFTVDKVALGQVFLLILLFSSIIIIPPMVPIHSLICHRRHTNTAPDSVVT